MCVCVIAGVCFVKKKLSNTLTSSLCFQKMTETHMMLSLLLLLLLLLTVRRVVVTAESGVVG